MAFDEDARWLVVRRAAAGVSVAVNLGDAGQDVPVAGAGELLLAWPDAVSGPGAAGVVHLPPDGVAVLADA